MKKAKIIILSVSIVVLLVVMQEFKFHLFGHLTDNFLLDNYNHYLPCDQLPTKEHVQSVLGNNPELVQRILSEGGEIGSGEDLNCEGTTDIIIFYGGHSQRVQIEKILGGKKFLGIPVRFRNV